MQMAGDHMQRRMRTVHGEAGTAQPYLIVDLHLQLRMRQLAVVIAAQDMHVQRSIAFAPAQPLLVPRSAMRRPMQDVAQDPQLAAGMPVQQPLQALQVFAGAAAGQRDAGAAEHIGLAQVQVCDQQCPPRGPVQRTRAHQDHGLAGKQQR
jgi:hypothetical protein